MISQLLSAFYRKIAEKYKIQGIFNLGIRKQIPEAYHHHSAKTQKV